MPFAQRKTKTMKPQNLATGAGGGGSCRRRGTGVRCRDAPAFPRSSRSRGCCQRLARRAVCSAPTGDGCAPRSSNRQHLLVPSAEITWHRTTADTGCPTFACPYQTVPPPPPRPLGMPRNGEGDISAVTSPARLGRPLERAPHLTLILFLINSAGIKLQPFIHGQVCVFVRGPCLNHPPRLQ